MIQLNRLLAQQQVEVARHGARNTPPGIFLIK